MKNLMTRYGGKTLPIVSSEWGYNTTDVTPQVQGDDMARMFLVNLSQGIPLSIWYDWKNDGTDPTNVEDNYGIVTADLVAQAGL